MAHPALERIVEFVLQTVCHIDEGRSAGPTVQILVAAAHGEIAAGAVEVHFDCPRAVAKVPEDECARRVRRVIDRAHVVDGCRLVIDVGQADDGGLVVDLAEHLSGRDGLQLEPEHVAQALGDIKIGREARLLGYDLAAPRPRSGRRGEQLEQADSGRIRDQQLIRLRTDYGREPGGDLRRPVDPLVLVPAGDQVLAPLALGGRRERGRRRPRQCAERIAVEVDDVIRNRKALPRECERVGCVEAFGFVGSHSFGKVTPFCPIYLPARSA